MLGAGDIGMEVLRVAKAFRMKTIGYKRSVSKDDAAAVDVMTTDLGEALADADILVNVLPSTAATQGKLDKDMLAQCKKKPLFINVSCRASIQRRMQRQERS